MFNLISQNDKVTVEQQITRTGINSFRIRTRARTGDTPMLEFITTATTDHAERVALDAAYDMAGRTRTQLQQFVDPWGRLFTAVNGRLMFAGKQAA